MTNSSQRDGYRQEMYATYVSRRAKDGGIAQTQAGYLGRVEAIRRLVRGWLPSDRSTPVLDMGCGQGELLCLLDQLGYTDLTGVDLGREQVELARQWCPRAKIIQGDTREVLAQSPGRFGLITGFDVIEHFGKDEVMPLLSVVAQALRPGGRVILQTPNAECPWFGAVAYGDFTHEWFFTPQSLCHLLQQVGLGSFQARPSKPYVHGLKSLARVILWSMLNPLLVLWNVAETGGRGSGIYTRVFVATAARE